MAFADTARELLELGMFQEARAELERLIHADECTQAERAEAYRLASKLYYKLKDLYAAKSCGEKALSLAESARLDHLVAEAHYALGIALTELGDTPEALDHLQAFLERRHLTPEGARLEPRAVFAVAQNLFRRRQYADAIATYQQAADLFARQGPQNLVAWCWRNIVDGLLLLDRPGEALPYLQRLESYAAANPDDLYIRYGLIVDKAHYHRITGELAISMGYCAELLGNPGRPGLTDYHRTECAWIAGLNALDLGDLDQARIFAGQALTCAIKAQWPFAINRANALRRRIAEAEAK